MGHKPVVCATALDVEFSVLWSIQHISIPHTHADPSRKRVCDVRLSILYAF